MRIEMVGGLGIGKSTLCKAMETVGFNCIYENLKTNPFLADCFVKPEDFRFPSQMWFVLSKFHEIKKFEEPGRLNVLDQAVLNVRAYTNMLFKDEDPDALGIIDECFRYMELQTGKPDLLIHLKCSPEEQMKRIRGRNRDHEKGVTLEYITELKDQLDHLVDNAKKDGYVVWDIDTEAVYLPGNVEYAMELTMKIADLFNIRLDKTMKDRAADNTSDDLAPVVEYVRLAEAV
jgi:deoxyadenosine/deoxycytidine kinase